MKATKLYCSATMMKRERRENIPFPIGEKVVMITKDLSPRLSGRKRAWASRGESIDENETTPML